MIKSTLLQTKSYRSLADPHTLDSLLTWVASAVTKEIEDPNAVVIHQDFLRDGDTEYMASFTIEAIYPIPPYTHTYPTHGDGSTINQHSIQTTLLAGSLTGLALQLEKLNARLNVIEKKINPPSED